MNKQELIEKLKSNMEYSNKLIEQGNASVYTKGKNIAYETALFFAKQLGEPQKTVVPKCAELFLKIAQSSTDVIQLFDSIIYATDSDGLILEKWGWSVDFYDWLAKDSDTLYILCDALRYGYEVEKEQLYVMPVPHVSYPVHYCVEDDHISFRQGNAQKFTQAELDKYFPDIKQFAVPVEEVEEG